MEYKIQNGCHNCKFGCDEAGDKIGCTKKEKPPTKLTKKQLESNERWIKYMTELYIWANKNKVHPAGICELWEPK